MKETKKEYIKNKLPTIFPVSQVVMISYRSVPKERNAWWLVENNFWEFYYIDRGDRSVFLDGKEYYIKAGQGMFYAPQQSHKTMECTGKSSNIVNISFACPSLDKDFFCNKVFTFNSFEKKIISNLISQGIYNFERVDNHPKVKGFRIRENTPAYVPHLIKASIEYLLLLLYSKKNTSFQANYAIGGNRQNQVSMMIESIIEYLHSNIDKSITVPELAERFSISVPYLKALFKKEINRGIIDYFNEIKINKAKELILEETHTLTEISEILGFSSTSYFSRLFKKKVDMSPSEFAKLVNHQLLFLR